MTSVNHNLIYENFESIAFRKITFSSEIFNNWPGYLLGAIVYRTLDFDWELSLTKLQCINSVSEISQ